MKQKNKIITIPNMLSFFRICLIPLIVWLYCVEKNSVWTGYILILSGMTDIVDGFIARTFQMISDFGKVLDPIADKLTQTAVLICLMLRFPMMMVPLCLLVVKEFFMTVTGYLIIQKSGIVLGADWHGKAATCLLYVAMFLHVFWESLPELLSNLMIAGCTGFILLSFILYGIRNFKVLNEHANNDKRVKV